MSTSIRVSRELHERLNKRAKHHHASLAEVIERALDAEDDSRFWDAVQATMTGGGPRASLRSESERSSGTLKDGLVADEHWDDIL